MISSSLEQRMVGFPSPKSMYHQNDARHWMGEFEARLSNKIDPQNSPLRIVKTQAKIDTHHLRLRPKQIAKLVLKPSPDTMNIQVISNFGHSRFVLQR